ncbi:MAG: ATP-dependent Clp protease proteolytic subunit, partial [Dokdonella sp.]
YVHHTGQPLDQIERDMERDRFMNADEAKTYGLIDEVLEHRPGETVKSA